MSNVSEEKARRRDALYERVIALRAQGLSCRAIAAVLGLGKTTVSTYLANYAAHGGPREIEDRQGKALIKNRKIWRRRRRAVKRPPRCCICGVHADIEGFFRGLWYCGEHLLTSTPDVDQHYEERERAAWLSGGLRESSISRLEMYAVRSSGEEVE
jgi:hypothetical protein